MKMKQISDTTIKITIQLEDLEERGMEMSDFLVPQEKTEEFFYAILDELEMPESFLDSGMLSFRVTPKPDRLDVFVTKSKIDKNIDFDDLTDLPDMEELAQMSPEEFLKTIEKNILEKSTEDIEAVQHLEEIEKNDIEVEEIEEVAEHYIYYILQFKNLAEVVRYAKSVNYAVDTSELYKMEGAYYLTVLIDMQHQPRQYPERLLATMREYTEGADITRTRLQEHGHLLLVNDAILNLQKVTYA